MGRVCDKHGRFVGDDEVCPYCEPGADAVPDESAEVRGYAEALGDSLHGLTTDEVQRCAEARGDVWKASPSPLTTEQAEMVQAIIDAAPAKYPPCPRCGHPAPPGSDCPKEDVEPTAPPGATAMRDFEEIQQRAYAKLLKDRGYVSCACGQLMLAEGAPTLRDRRLHTRSACALKPAP